MSRSKYTEQQQRQFFIDSFNIENEQIFCEVPVFCRSIDLVKLNEKTQLITAIEFKLHDWKRAIKQALAVSICFDFLEICIPKPKTIKTQERIVDECKQYGIGVYFFDETTTNFHNVLKPKKISQIWEVQRKQVIKYVRGNNE